MYCKHCANQLSDEAKFCGKCGQVVADSSEEKSSIGTDDAPVHAPAGVWKRFFNYILDRFFSILIMAVILSIIIALDAPQWLSYSIYLVYVLYYIIFEAIWQKTIAKYITKTKVVMRDGTKPPFKNIVGRTFARIIPFEQFSFLFGSYPIGWHDGLSSTIVVPSSYTEADVKKIDFVKIKKEKTNNTALVIVGIIVALFIVIAIIGVLSSVVLVSLNTARTKAQEISMKNQITSVRAGMELYRGINYSYSNADNCYSGAFLDSELVQNISSLKAYNPVCYARGDSYAISAALNSSRSSYCIDNNGFNSDGVAVSSNLGASCLIGTASSSPLVSSDSSWKTFHSVQDGFTVLLPGDPKFSSEQDNTSRIPFVTDSYVVSSGVMNYYIYKYKFASNIDAKPETILEGALNGMVNVDKNNKLMSSSYGAFESHTSLDFVITNKEESVKGKLIMLDQSNMFLLMADMKNSTSSDYNRFINSFTLK